MSFLTSSIRYRECASHFETMVNDDLDDSVQSYDDVILWLWKAHNKVNARLKGAKMVFTSLLGLDHSDNSFVFDCYIRERKMIAPRNSISHF